jgi:HPt (histidine-containing phosphotransfer) domain-containing protein
VSGGRLEQDVDVLDREALRALSELLGGDREAFADVVDAFVDEAPERLSELRLGAERGDPALAARAAHTLKSNALTFGAVEFADLCRSLEAAAGQDELAGSRDLIDLLDVRWRGVRAQLAILREEWVP